MRSIKIYYLLLAFLLVLPAQHASAGWIVDVYEGLGPFTDINDAKSAMISAGTPTSSGTFEYLNFSEGGIFGNFGGDSLFPGSPSDLFGVHAYGEITLVEGVQYFGLNHDDGALFELLGGLAVILSSAPTPPINSFGGVSCLGCGTGYPFMADIWLYENTGVASLEFFYSDGVGGVGRLVPTVPEPGTLALLGLGLIGAGFARRRKQA